MYSVSDEYINQLKQEIQERRLSGTIGNLTFDDEDVLAGSFSISGRCMPNTNLTYGSVEITTLKVTFFNDFAREIPRTTYKGLEIRPTVSLKVGNTWETVPCGVFTVDEATWTEIGVTLTAYDNMAKFDREVNLDITAGYPYDLLSLACQYCGVQFGNTQAEIEAMTNGEERFFVNPENDIETWRDFIYWTAQVLAGFATCDRQGRLVIRQFGNDTGVELLTNQRFTGIKLSDFVTSYTGLSVTLIENDTTEYRGAAVDTGLVMNLGSNPLLQDVETRGRRMDAIVDELITLEYTPFTCKLIGDMCFDLGDVIHFDGGVAYEDNCCIMAYSYTFGKEYTAQGFGDNPALANARGKTDKELSGIKSRTRANVVEMRTFVNASEVLLEDDVDQTIISIDFTTIDDTNISIFHEIQLDCLSEDMSVEVTYHLDDAEMTYHPVENWSEDGKHILSLMYFLSVLGNKAYTWTVSLKVTGGNAEIGRDNIRACLSGQGLAAVSKWAGRINVEEELGIISMPLTPVAIMNIAESCGVSLKEYYVESIPQNIGLISMDGTPVAIMGMHEDMWFLEPLSELTWEEASAFTWGELEDDCCWGNEYPV